MKFSALNDSSSSDDDESALKDEQSSTKESQESQAVSWYHAALEIQRLKPEEIAAAENLLQNVLRLPLILEISSDSDEDSEQENSCRLLKCNTLKNLATLAACREEYDTALGYCLQATCLDDSDAILWQKTARLAIKVNDLYLARTSLLQGLRCNADYWPCLDTLISVLYALGEHAKCVGFFLVALRKDPGHLKSLVFVDDIFRRQPSTRAYCWHHVGNLQQNLMSYSQAAGANADTANAVLQESLTWKKKHFDADQSESEFGRLVKAETPMKSWTMSEFGAAVCNVYEQQQLHSFLDTISMSSLTPDADKSRTFCNIHDPVKCTADVRAMLTECLHKVCAADEMVDENSDGDVGKMMAEVSLQVSALLTDLLDVVSGRDEGRQVSQDAVRSPKKHLMRRVAGRGRRGPRKRSLRTKTFVEEGMAYYKRCSLRSQATALASSQLDTLGGDSTDGPSDSKRSRTYDRSTRALFKCFAISAYKSTGPDCVRLFWLKHKYQQLCAVGAAVSHPDLDPLYRLQRLLDGIASGGRAEMVLPSLVHDNVISFGVVERELRCLQRAQSVAKVDQLFAGGEYTLVAELLVEELLGHKARGVSAGQRRYRQLVMLQEAWVRTGAFQEAVSHAGECISEALVARSKCEEDSKPLWTHTINKLLDNVARCFERQPDVLQGVSRNKQAGLVTALLDAASYILRQQAGTQIGTFQPWLLLYHMLKFWHSKEGTVATAVNKVGSGEDSNDFRARLSEDFSDDDTSSSCESSDSSDDCLHRGNCIY